MKVYVCCFLCLCGVQYVVADASSVHKISIHQTHDVDLKSHHAKTSKRTVTARFNFEHVRFQFIASQERNELKKVLKRKRFAFSNLV